MLFKKYAVQILSGAFLIALTMSSLFIAYYGDQVYRPSLLQDESMVVALGICKGSACIRL